jgi:hypothetical protein
MQSVDKENRWKSMLKKSGKSKIKPLKFIRLEEFINNDKEQIK